MKTLQEVALEYGQTIDETSFNIVRNTCYGIHTDIDNGQGIDPKTFLSRYGENAADYAAHILEINLDEYENRLIRNMRASGREVSIDYARAVYKTLRTIQKYLKEGADDK